MLDLMRHWARLFQQALHFTVSLSVPSALEFYLKRPIDAGLTTEERDLVVTAYDRGIIQVLVATCSLAAGINLPARRVILHGAKMGTDLVGPALL